MAKARKSVADQARQRLAGTEEQARREIDQVATAAAPDSPRGAYAEVPIGAVVPNPRNVRESLGDLSELVASVTESGILQALVVRPAVAGDDLPDGARYVTVMGHRRLAAAAEAGLARVPVVVRSDIDHTTERRRMLVENLQREDLTPLEEARAFQAELDAGISQRQLARELGVSQAHVSRRVSLLRMDDGVQQAVLAGQLSVDVAVNDLGKVDRDQQAQVLATLVETDEGEWSGDHVRQALQQVAYDRERDTRKGEQRKIAEEAGAKVLDEHPSEVLGAQYYRRQLHDEEAIAAAAVAGELVAVVSGYGEQPQYYTTGAAPKAASDDREARERREWRERVAGVDAWVSAQRRVSKTAAAEAAIRHVVIHMSSDDGHRVWKWVRGSIGADVDDYYEWQRSLSEADYPQLAYLLTVASDLQGSRYNTKGEAAERTAARIKEVSGG